MAHALSEARIVVFAKAPRPGTVKTRLTPLLGKEGAAALHARLVERTLATACAAAIGSVDLFCAPDIDDAFLRSCAARYRVRLENQSAGDLGARMLHAVESTLENVPYAIVVGTDCPVLTAEHFREARRKLAAGRDAVIVPTEDGGYALIGLKRCERNIFNGVSWGTSSVIAETRQRLVATGWQWEELEELWDVDRPEDYQRLVASGVMNQTGHHS